MAGGGKMILGSDSHTRYGALGTMAVGEGGGELAKQLLGRTYDFARPQVIAIYLTGKPRPGIGPHDVALSICGAVYKKGYVKNKVMEFVGPGIAGLPIEYPQRHRRHDHRDHLLVLHLGHRRGDRSSYYTIHGRPEDLQEAAACGGGLLRRLRLHRPVHHRVHHRHADAPLQHLHHPRAAGQRCRYPARCTGRGQQADQGCQDAIWTASSTTVPSGSIRARSPAAPAAPSTTSAPLPTSCGVRAAATVPSP